MPRTRPARSRAANVPTLAIDIPSGVDGTTGEVRGDAVQADETVCFAALKPGLVFEPGRTRAGRVHVADIGIDPTAPWAGAARLHVLEAADLSLPARPAGGHKWSSGVLIVGGSTGLTGAPVMAGHAAARTGAGMVVCGVPGRDAAARAGGSELVTRALPATADGALDTDAAEVVLADIERFRALAIGPGLGRDARTQTAVQRIVAACPVPIVVDADGLNALAADPDALHARRAAGFPPAILTPHAGEYARLANKAVDPDRVAAARPRHPVRRDRSAEGSGHGRRRARRPRGREPNRQRRARRPRVPATSSPASSPGCSRRVRPRSMRRQPARTCTDGRPPRRAPATGSSQPTSSARCPLRWRRCAPESTRGTGMADEDAYRPVWAEVDLDAVRTNVRSLRALVAPAALCAVVKADGYGHGAVPVSRAAVDAGADCLAVALVEEGVQLRTAGIEAPIIVLSEPVPAAADTVVGYRLTPVVYTATGIDALAKAVADRAAEPLLVHLKVDTGMHRVGCDPDDAVELAAHVVDRAELRLAGVCTHFAVADEPGNEYTEEQQRTFERVLADLRAQGLPTGVVHACNTAAAIAVPGARYDMVRAGIGIYGIAPAAALAGVVDLVPALSVKARVSHVQELPAGARLSYGLRYETSKSTRIATVPIGYADGVPRELPHRGGEALIGGRRHAMAGTVTMDQLMIDVGDQRVEVGDEVVLIGRQGDAQITAEEWADRMDTIAYTIVCGVGPRVPRRYP